VGKPTAAALDNGYFSAVNVKLRSKIATLILTSPQVVSLTIKIGTLSFKSSLSHPKTLPARKVKMAYKLQTEIGQAIYRLRKCTVEPVIGIIKEVLGFANFPYAA
jgi:aromatic ring-opening dioxygenase LigB subunit